MCYFINCLPKFIFYCHLIVTVKLSASPCLFVPTKYQIWIEPCTVLYVCECQGVLINQVGPSEP